MNKKRFVILLLFISSGFKVCLSQTQLYEGNKAYYKGAYKEAGEHYAEAFSRSKSREAEYNLGNTLYQQQQFDTAVKHFSDVAATSANPDLKAAAYYNLGNSLMKGKKWEEAIKSFRESLKLKPDNEAAKYNMEYARKMRQAEVNQPKKKDDNNDKQEPKPSEAQDKEDNKNQNQPAQKPKPMPSKMSKEQADQLLNALNQEEKKLHEKNEKNKGLPMKLEKDW